MTKEDIHSLSTKNFSYEQETPCIFGCTRLFCNYSDSKGDSGFRNWSIAFDQSSNPRKDCNVK